MNYFKLTRFLQKGDKGLFDVPFLEQKNFLDGLGDARNDFERSFKQYLCQQLFTPAWKRLLMNLISALVFPLAIFYSLSKRVLYKKGAHVETLMQAKDMDEVVPPALFSRYDVSTIYWNEGQSLSFCDIPFIFKIIRCSIMHPYFALKASMNVARYSHMVYRHTPDNIIVFGEYSFSSSILSAYCNSKGIKHINVMHGEKLYYIRDSYFRFDECYVWSEHYKNLFVSMMAEPTQFKIHLPPSMQIDCSNYLNTSVYADYKYYLAVYEEDEIKSIVSSLQFIKSEGKTLKYRIHPRYSNVQLLLKYVDESEVEYPKDVTIQESISNLKFAIGSYTTVLTQAYFARKKIILDDVTFKKQFEKLQSLKYILSSMDSIKLSDCQ